MTNKPSGKDWALLILLSMIWGGSFMFNGIAVKELPALLIVFARLGLAALILIPVHLILQGPLPRDGKTWFAAGGMALLNNVLPFIAIAWGQHYIGSGLASVINATTPIFTALLMALFALEALTTRKILALCLGFLGVIVLKGGGFADLSSQSLGIFAVMFASFFYGLSAVWSKLKLVGIPPMTMATCQLTISGLVMAALSFGFSDPMLYAKISLSTWVALTSLAVLSSAIAYLIFFRIIATAGASFVTLVTMLVPLSAIVMGIVVLHESLSLHELIGAAIIISALILIDGRLPAKLGLKLA